MHNYPYQPVKYYALVLLITWAALFLAAYCSYDESLAAYQAVLMLVGLLTPFIITMAMIFGSGDPALKRDFILRLVQLQLIKPRYWLAILLIMPLALLAATALSLLFGQPVEQFSLSPDFTASGGATLMLLIMLFLAPTFEELSWRGYGVDSLRKEGRSLFVVTLVFALLWGLWHLPLFFIKGYYQYELLQENGLYALNFMLSLLPAAFLMNWIFYKTGRSITAIILFHAMLNLYSALLQTEQFTKCIITILLSFVAVIVVWRDTDFFFDTK
jgi:uncharacterized protein